VPAVIPIITAAAGVYSAVDSADKARKATNQANDAAKAAAAGTGGGTVNIASLDQQARDIAAKNAAGSAALEAQYNPGAAELRASSLQQLMNLPSVSPETRTVADQIAAQAGTAPSASYDSPLLRDAIAKAQADLALGGELPQDVRNLVVRNALAKSGAVTGKLDLGRDLSTRDLGLTSLDLENRRLANAAAIGGQEAGLEQGNANLDFQSQLAGTNNLFNSANFLSSIDSGQLAAALSKAQLGQNIAQPMSGLDPGSVVNLAVGNSNVAANAQQQSAAIAAEAAKQKQALSGQLLGTGLGFIQNYLNKPKTTAPTYSYTTPTTYGAVGYTPPATNYTAGVPAVFCWVAQECYGKDGPEWTQFRDWLLSSGHPEFVEFYRQNGEEIARAISGQPKVKELIRHLMDAAKGGV
jgi:hypothetical protein